MCHKSINVPLRLILTTETNQRFYFSVQEYLVMSDSLNKDQDDFYLARYLKEVQRNKLDG